MLVSKDTLHIISGIANLTVKVKPTSNTIAQKQM